MYNWKTVDLGLIALPFVPVLMVAVLVGGAALMVWQLFGILGAAVEECIEDTRKLLVGDN